MATIDDDRLLTDKLCDIDEGLNEWEVNFVESIAKQTERGEILTPAQREKANEILDKKG